MSITDDSAQVWETTRKKLIPATIIGSLMEWYDNAIYGQAAALVLGSLFFPAALGSTAGRLAAFATFAVGYAARPLGGIIFGHIGDKYGRKVALVASLLVMGLSSTLIGLLPTYASIGITAPILLVVLRILQGSGVGAEYAGAITMVAEHAPKAKRGYYASLPAFGVFLGIGLAAGITALVALLPHDQLISWGWRIPFLVSIILVAVGLFIRLRVLESPVFEKLAQRRERAKLPFIKAFKTSPRRLLLAMVVIAGGAFSTYVAQTYALGYLADRGVSETTSLVALLFSCAIGAVAIPIVGVWSDRRGRKPLYIGLLIFLALVSFPFFMLLDTGAGLLVGIGLALGFGIGCLAVFGTQSAFLPELFDARYRFSAVALTREIPTALIGGPAPLVATALTAASGGSPWLVATVMAVLAIIGIIALLFLPETRHVNMFPDSEAELRTADSLATPTERTRS